MANERPYWPLSSENYKKLILWGTGAAVLPVIGAAAWWIAETSFNRVTPYQYHYRPGTISGWISDLFAKHAQWRRGKAPIRVYMDGCFDMMHYGHANALRQAKALGDVLVVGLIPDREILAVKGPPVMNEQERMVMVSSLKWVDEVLTDVPYDLTPEFLEELFTKHHIDYVVHGDDPCLLPDGTDAYATAKKKGRFRMIKRTEGVSSTDIVGRMLMCTRDNSRFREVKRELAREFSKSSRNQSGILSGVLSSASSAETEVLPPAPARHTTISRFMPTSRRIVQFSDGQSAPPDAKVVYIDGAFDLFHPGHVEILKLAKAQGDFILVGLHSDEDVAERRGPHLPIMGLHERSLSVLACRYVNEVIIGAPMRITEDLITTFNISLVVRGTVTETAHSHDLDEDRYAVPQAKGIFKTLESPSQMTTATIIERIVHNRSAYEARNAKKTKSEQTYYTSTKQYVDEV